MSDPLIITVAGIGAELTKENTPYLPVTPDEIVEEAIRVFNLGARIFHLHVRDDQGKPTCDPQRIKSIIDRIRQKVPMILQVSTGGAIGDALEDRLNTLEAGSEMGSLTLGSVNFGNDVFLNTVPIITALAQKMLDKKIKPELEIFDTAMMEEAQILLKKRLIKSPLHINIILGGPGWLSATVENLEFILKKMPAGSSWSASGVGRGQLTMIEYAIIHGGHVRTGLEDNIYRSKGVLAKGNAELVGQVVELARKHKRKIATPDEAQKILGIKM
ncbi:MAG: 3-keto-5-aminohexanoate cleavage protein [Deltaproteobacteria bacterium]|nr:3-keto-5-aminohexanoate cleavage protein [Deltaproteobacteria bacterium]